MSEVNCKCPFPTLNGHHPHCVHNTIEQELDKHKPIYHYGFAREKLEPSDFRTQYEAQFEHTDNAVFNLQDIFPPANDQQIKEAVEGGKIDRVFGVNLHPIAPNPETKWNVFIQDIPITKEYNREAIFELGDEKYYKRFAYPVDLWAQKPIEPLSKERREAILNIIINDINKYVFSAQAQVTTSCNKAHFDKLMETPIESYRKMSLKYYGEGSFEYPELKNTSERLTKAQFTQLKEAAQKATREKMAPIIKNGLLSNIEYSQMYEMDDILIYENIEANPNTELEKILTKVNETLPMDKQLESIYELSSMQIYSNLEVEKSNNCVCQQLFTKGHETNCYLYTPKGNKHVS